MVVTLIQVAKDVYDALAPFRLQWAYDVRLIRWEKDLLEAPVASKVRWLSVEESQGYKSISDVLTASGHRAVGDAASPL